MKNRLFALMSLVTALSVSAPAMAYYYVYYYCPWPLRPYYYTYVDIYGWIRTTVVCL